MYSWHCPLYKVALEACSDKVRTNAKFSLACKAWGALAGINTNTPGAKAISLPSKFRLPFPYTTVMTAFRVEVCSSISVAAAKQKSVYWLLLSLSKTLLKIPLLGYSIKSCKEAVKEWLGVVTVIISPGFWSFVLNNGRKALAPNDQ
jgi:hypothetical protein